jgi:hypothetical protein
MKMSRSIIILLLVMVSSPLFSLDIYFNDILWQSYHQEDLESLQIKFSEIDEGFPAFTAIPFIELLPLMTETEGMRIMIPSGDIFLNEDLDKLRTSSLRSLEGSNWELILNNSVYHNPRRIEIYGTLIEQKKFLLWTEPDLTGIENQIRVWSSLHKVDVEIKELISISDELIHRQMTGDLMPDFVLQFQDASLPYDDTKTIGFILQSLMIPLKGQAIDTLVLPSGQKLHPDLFLSILASLSERISPYDPGFLTGTEGIKKASLIYLDQILNHKIVEQDDFFLDETYRNNLFGFFPARDFPRQSGFSAALPQLPGMNRALSPRVYPLQLLVKNEMIQEGALLDFLKLPEIQYNLLSSDSRQLPENTEALENRELNDEEQKLYEEWKRGYILCQKNYSFRRNLEKSLPDLFRGEGDLPR